MWKLLCCTVRENNRIFAEHTHTHIRSFKREIKKEKWGYMYEFLVFFVVMVYFSIASNIGSYITEARSFVDITVPTDARCFGSYTCTYRCTLLRYVHMYLPMHAASVDIHVPTEALPCIFVQNLDLNIDFSAHSVTVHK